MNEFFSSFRRVYLSAKVKAAIGGAVAAWGAAAAASSSVPVDQRIYLWLSCILATAWMGQQVIAAWRAEDVAEKSKPLPPAVAVMTGDAPTNVQNATPPSVAESDVPPRTAPLQPPRRVPPARVAPAAAAPENAPPSPATKPGGYAPTRHPSSHA